MSSSYNAICIYKCNRRLEDNELLAEINNSESQIMEIINVNGGVYDAELTYLINMCFKYVKCAIYEFKLSTSSGKYEDLESLITFCEEDIIKMNTTIDHICNTTTSSTAQQPYYC